MICIACDIPASRKVGGFLAHSARLGCNKCKREFGPPGRGASSFHDFSPGDPRTNQEHREQATLVKQGRTKQDRSEMERETGVMYTELLRLSYYQPIRFLVIDPMHNLFLGTAKHVFKSLWTNQESTPPILSKPVLQNIQDRIDKVKPPPFMGRIPLKITSDYSGLTADQWRTWTVVYSPFALCDIQADHLR